MRNLVEQLEALKIHPRLLELLFACLVATLALSCLEPRAANAQQFKADQPVPDTAAQRLLACTGCHGPEGRAGPDGYYPRIAGKPAAYLYQQLLNFRDGRRSYQPMQRLLQPLSDHYLFEIAEYFSALDLPYPQPSPNNLNPVQTARARLLVHEGDKALGIASCASCHGQRLTGIEPAVPGLLGLPRDYINAQLGAWRNRQRHTGAPDCMAEIAAKLPLGDVSVLSAWLASQPLPASTRAQPVPSVAGAIDCYQAKRPASTPEAIESRGEYLARIGNCAGCHAPPGGTSLEGGYPVQTPFGVVYSSNLTPDPQHGIGRWSKSDFWNAMRHGISRDARLLSPAFPYANYSLLTRADSDALFDWLQARPAVARPNRPSGLRWPYNTRIALWAWRALYFKPEQFNDDPTRSAAWNRGAYLVQGLGHCGACHTPRNRWGATDPARPLAGALLPNGSWYAPSLRDRAQGSLATMDIADAARFLQSGLGQHAVMLGPMADIVRGSLQYLSADDAVSMATYLSDLPGVPRLPPPSNAVSSNAPSLSAPVPNAPVPNTPVPNSPVPTAPAPQAPASVNPADSTQSSGSGGAALYERHCADCHGKSGEGRRDVANRSVYSKLAGNRSVNLKDTSNLINSVLHGNFAPSSQHAPKPFGMPPFLLTLDDVQIASVLTYIRNAWGNSASVVDENDVFRLRGSTGK